MKTHPLVIVTSSVLLGLLSAVLLKEAASQQGMSWIIMGVIILAVMVINGFKFILWGIAHRNHPLSLTYPLNSIFFPLIFIVSHLFYGEPVTIRKIVGTVLIVVGVSIITYFDNSVSEGV